MYDMGLQANGQERFLEKFLVQKGGVIIAQRQALWAGRGTLLLCEAGAYMLRAQGREDMQGV